MTFKSPERYGYEYLSNDFTLTSDIIAFLYHKRWDEEKYFDIEICARKDGERKMRVIFSIFAKKEGNSRAIGRIFSRNRGNSSHFFSELAVFIKTVNSIIKLAISVISFVQRSHINSCKTDLGNTKAWAKSPVAIEQQALFGLVTHILMRLLLFEQGKKLGLEEDHQTQKKDIQETFARGAHKPRSKFFYQYRENEGLFRAKISNNIITTASS